MVYAYIMRRTERRCQIKWDDFRDKRVHDAASGRDRIDVPQKYREAREKVCTDAFLAMRSRRSRQDFVEYFIGTLCSEPQFLPEDEYYGLTDALLGGETAWEDVKALAMLASRPQTMAVTQRAGSNTATGCATCCIA